MMDLQRILLGSLMIKPELASDVLGELDIDLFDADIQPVYAALLGLFDATGKLDAVAACERYPALKIDIGACLDAIEADCIRPSRENVVAWTRMLRQRRAVERFQAIALEAAGAATTYEDLPGYYDRLGQAMDAEMARGDFEPAGELIDDYIRSIGTKPTYIPTGLSKLDRYLHIAPGSFVLIGGRPSAGKTALSLQMAVEQALRGYRVCYFSLETSPQVLIRRVIANRLCTPLADIQAGRVHPAELDALVKLRHAPLYFKSASGRSVSWMRAQAARKKAQIVYVDYVQIIAESGKDRYTQITRTSVALHELAQSTGMVVVGIAQLNRNAAHTTPSMADLRESGQLEQDADAIILLGGEECEHPFALAKNKEGQAGLYFDIAFDKNKQRFLEVTP